MPHSGFAFDCPSLTAGADELRALGIFCAEPHGLALYYREDEHMWAEIGAVLVIGDRIIAIPRERLTPRQTGLLLGAAEQAFHTPPRKAHGWRHGYGRDVGGRWTCLISVPVDEFLDSATAIRHAQSVARVALPSIDRIAGIAPRHPA